jgi:hypothetical protein
MRSSTEQHHKVGMVVQVNRLFRWTITPAPIRIDAVRLGTDGVNSRANNPRRTSDGEGINGMLGVEREKGWVSASFLTVRQLAWSPLIVHSALGTRHLAL